MTKTTTGALAFGIVALSLGVFGVAAAQTQTRTTMPMVVQIGSRGNALVRGTLQSVTANSLTLQSWGGTWTVNVAAGARTYPTGVNISQFRVGDFIGASGTVNQSAEWTINASVVRDWGYRASASQPGTPQPGGTSQSSVFMGVVISTSPYSLTVRGDNGMTYTVSIGAGTQVSGMNGQGIPAMSYIRTGDRVSVSGNLTGASAVTALVVRDLSR